jgi:hypothetical protein
VRSATIIKSVAATIAASICVCMPALAEASDTDIANAIARARILQPGYAVRAAFQGDTVRISTYRNPNNTDMDNRIDAILLAKTAFDLAGDSAARVLVQLYERDLSSYTEIAVTAGDVKAYAAGQVSKDQLLAGLSVEKRNAPGKNKDSLSLQMGSVAPDITANVDEAHHSVELIAPASVSVNDDQLKVNALIMAMNAHDALPEGTNDIKITFIDPSYRGETRQFDFPVDEVGTMWKSLLAPLSAIRIAKQPVSLEFLRAAEGPALNERRDILQRLKGLHKAGVGVQSFINAYLNIEAGLRRNDEAATVAACKELTGKLDVLEKARAAAGEKPVPRASVATQAAVALNAFMLAEEGGTHFVGGIPVIANEVLQDPASIAHKFELHFSNNPKMLANAYLKIAGVLRKNGRPAEAVPYEQKAVPLWRAGGGQQ